MDLESGEKVIFEGHPSWRSILGFYIKGLVVAIVAGAIVALITKVTGDKDVKKGLVAVVFIVILAVVIVFGYFKRLFTTYTISTHRLHIKRGFISRSEQQTAINRVQNVNTNQSVLERLLQIGTVDFDTAAGDDYDFQFQGVEDPRDVVEAVHKAQREADGQTGRIG